MHLSQKRCADATEKDADAEHTKDDGYTPLVVMAEKYGKDVEGTDVNVSGNDWILYLGEELKQLQNLLRRLTSQ